MDAEFRWQEAKEGRKRELLPTMQQLKTEINEIEEERANESDKKKKGEEETTKIQDTIQACQNQVWFLLLDKTRLEERREALTRWRS